MVNWDALLVNFEPAKGYSPITSVSMPEGRDPLLFRVNCQENVDPVGDIIRERVKELGIPESVVAFEYGGRVRPDVVGYNVLEECGAGHPAGFGGYYLTDESTFHVYLLHPSASAAEEVMLFQLGPSPAGERRIIHALQGDYTYRELENWYGHFFADWWDAYSGSEPSEYSDLVRLPGYRHDAPPSLTHAGTSPRLNRILFRLDPDFDTEAIGRSLRSRLATLGIPDAAVVIEVGLIK